MTPNPRAKLFMNIRSHLRRANLQFFERARERQFLLMMRGDALTVSQLITVRPDGVAFRIETRLPIVVPTHRRVAAAELVARLNRLTERGHYDLDIDTGDVCFRIDCHALTSMVIGKVMLAVLGMALRPLARDWRVFEAVLLREADPVAAIKENAERIARETEAKQRADRAAATPPLRRKDPQSPIDAEKDLHEMIDELMAQEHAADPTAGAPEAFSSEELEELLPEIEGEADDADETTGGDDADGDAK
jgi:hypothetical protein